MLSGCFRLADCITPPQSPPYTLAHPFCVGSFVATHENGWSVFVFEGNPKSIPFSGYKQGKLSEFDYQFLKKQVLAWTKQSLVIEFIKNPYVSIQISRGHHASCGLFVVKKDTSLYLHWDPVELYQYLEGTDILDKDRCAAFLTCRWHYGVETLFKDIKQLPERVAFSFSEKGLSIIRPPHLAPLNAQPLKAGADPVSMLHHLVAEEIKGYALPSPYAAELSSGLDTALVAYNLTQLYGADSVLTIGYLPMGQDCDIIRARRHETILRLGCRDHAMPIENYFEAGYQKNTKYWPYQAPSLFEKEAAALKISAAGGRIVFSGIGGDELCYLTQEERELLPKKKIPSCPDPLIETILPEALYRRNERQEYDAWPVGLVPESGHDVAQTISFGYLRHGVWYAHPLNSAEIQSFAHFLPIEWRQDRRLSREALKKCGFSEAFLQQTPKESLSTSLDQFVLGWPQLEAFFRNSRLAEAGLIDIDKINQAHHILKTTPDESAGLYLTLALALERSLRSL